METKKVKKLVISQEVISNLQNSAMSRIKGGTGTGDWFCGGSGTCTCNTCYANCLTYGGCPTLGCPDTDILQGPCATYDYEICRESVDVCK